MKVKVIIVSVIFLLFLVIILQNTQPESLTILAWKITMPFILMLLSTLIIGLVSGMLLSSLVFQKSKAKAEAKK